MSEDLERLKKHYKEYFLKENYWNDFNPYPFILGQTQYSTLIKIFKEAGINSPKILFNKKILDIGSGEGILLSSFLKLGANIRNITAVELIEERFIKLKENFPNASLMNSNYLEFQTKEKYNIITLFAVLSSILDDEIRRNLIYKAYNELAYSGILIIYDYNKSNSKIISDYYKSVSFQQITRQLSLKNGQYKNYSKIYINARLGKGLCKINCEFLVPFLQYFKIFNDDYSFLVIRKD